MIDRQSAAFLAVFRRAGSWGTWVAAGLVIAALAASRAAHAHGRLPGAGLAVVDPTDPSHLIVRTTFGLVATRDGGARWDWICPDAAFYDADIEDPAVAIGADGTVLAGVFNGLAVSHDGCGWALAGGELDSRSFSDVALESGGQGIVALSANGITTGTYEVHLWQSGDVGRSFSELGTSPPQDFLAITLALSAADPNRIYLSGADDPTTQTGVIMRSDDRGQTWQRKAVPGAETDDTRPYILGTDPRDENVVFVANVTRDADLVTAYVLLVTRDGGDSFTSVFQRDHGVPGFALSPDGSQLALGSDQDGLWMGPSDTAELAQVNTVRTRCVAWTNEALYVCSDPYTEGFALGVSHDAGATVDPLLALTAICGPATECSETSSVGSECTPAWPEERAELAAEPCDGAGGAGAGTSGPRETGSCSCAAAGGQDAPWGAVAVALGLGALWMRRRPR